MKITVNRTKIMFLVLLFVCSFSNYLYAEYPSDDTTKIEQLTEYTTYIADFNGDSIQDSLMSYIRTTHHSFPTSIHWGRLISDTSKKIGIFKYPTWSQIDARVSVDNYDQDSLSDMIFYLWGNIQQDSLTKIDTGKVLMIWGQSGLDSLTTINIDSLALGNLNPITLSYPSTENYNSGFRSNIEEKRFECKELLKEKEIINPVCISNTKGASFELRIPKRKNKKEVDTTFHKEKDKYGVSIYPNPTDGTFYFKAETLPIGIYNFIILNNSGQKIFQEILTVNAIETISKNLDISLHTNGIYYLVILNKNQIICKYKIIKMK